MNRIETTDEAFIAAMRAAVAERGEGYVYPREWRMLDDGAAQAPADLPARGTCRYLRPDGQGPACLIGDALHRVGVSTAELAKLDRSSPGAPAAIAVTVSGLSRVVIDAASTAQSHQDQGLSWGGALDAFRRELRPTPVAR